MKKQVSLKTALMVALLAVGLTFAATTAMNASAAPPPSTAEVLRSVDMVGLDTDGDLVVDGWLAVTETLDVSESLIKAGKVTWQVSGALRFFDQ